MDKLMHLYTVFVTTVAPVLLATAIPSIVVALTPYPKAKGFLRVLSYVAQFLSVLTHKDSPGTLKAPFVPVFADKEEPKLQLPPGSSARVLLPLAFLALALSACATAGGKALKACELAQLPAESQALASSVTAIAMDSGSAVSDLEQLAIAVGKAQFVCIVQAVEGFLSKPAPTTASVNAFAAAAADVRRDHALQVLRAFLAAHPSACGERTVL